MNRLGNRVEGLVLVLIVILVGAAAGAASFTHVHDWTMHNSPADTPGWFGWANAVISELVPIAALLTIRQRRRTGGPIGYPLFLLIAAATLSLAAQLAVAKPGLSGWLLSAVPALAFMALVKLVLVPVKATDTGPASATDPLVTDQPATIAGRVEQPAASAADNPVTEPVPTHLIPVARFASVQHEQATGTPITVDELAGRLDITTTIADRLLTELRPAPLPAHLNGVAVLDGTR